MTKIYTRCNNCGAEILRKHPEYEYHYCNGKCKSEHRRTLKASNVKIGKRPRGLLYRGNLYRM